MGASSKRSLSRGHDPLGTSTTLKAMTFGINAVSGLADMHPQDLIYTYNAMPTEYGLEVRQGYREWVTGVVGEVRTIIPYHAVVSSNDRLFAASEDGIYDVTVPGSTAPTRSIEFPSKTEDSGRGVFLQFADAADAQFIYYADQANGLFLYTASTGVWEQAPAFTGTDGPPAPVDIVFIMQHKLRIWFIGRDLTNAWYLGINATSGDAEKFTLTGKFKHGGSLEGMWNWTVDGGDGVDDYLVLVSRSGDIIVYRGEDPSQAETWSNVGTWFVGELPAGRRQAAGYGGELYLLATSGVISMRDLLEGVDPANNESSPSYRVSRLIREQMRTRPASPEWSLQYNTFDNQLQIIIPQLGSEAYLQLCQDLITKAWGFWRGVPMLCSDNWQERYYFGTDDGRVMIMDGYIDNDPLSRDAETPVEFSFLSSYQNMEAPGIHKRVHFIRPKGIVSGGTSLVVKPVYDFNLNPLLANPTPPDVNADALWDASQWDKAVWAGIVGGLGEVAGGVNMGLDVALAVRGTTANALTIVAFDTYWEPGGWL